MGEMFNERHHLGDLYSLEEAQAMVHRLSFETGHKLIGTPWTDENLLNIEGKRYSNLRQEQLDVGIPEALVNVLYLAALADVRLLIFDPDATVLDGLAIFDE